MKFFTSDENEKEKLIDAIKNKKVIKVKSILENLNKNKNKLVLNNNLLSKLLNSLLLTTNEQEEEKLIEMFKLLIEYANQHQIILELNKKEENLGENLFLLAIKNKKTEMVKILIEYATQHQIKLELNKKENFGGIPLIFAISYNDNSVEIVKLLMEYANQHQFILELNEKNSCGIFPLLLSISYNDSSTEMVKLLIEYANQHQIILELNNKDEIWGDYPLLKATEVNNVEIVKLLMEYATQHQIILELNEKNNNGKYPLLKPIERNHIEIVKLLLEYASQHQIILELNEKNEKGDYLFSRAIFNNNIELVILLAEYALQHQISLEYDRNINGNGNNSEIMEIVQIYEREKRERLERERNEREGIEREPIQRILEIIERERLERERLEREEIERERLERERLERERLERERLEREEIEREILEREILERESLERERLERERLERERLERKRLETERIWEIIERERARFERERTGNEGTEEEGLDREEIERERLEREQLERERLEREQLERERLEREQLERERLERERLERERLEGERLERERLERERLERERLERERLERERLERERLERERFERDIIESERLKEETLIFNDIKNQKIEIGKKQNNNNNDNKPQTPTLVIATNNFDGSERYDYLDIKKNEFLIVTDWNCGEKGWVYGYRKNNKEEKGIFPEVFIKIYKDEDIDKNALKSVITPEYKIRFENKVNKLRSLNKMNILDSTTVISINRSNLFGDAYNAIMSKSPQDLKKRLKIRYIGEEGIDAGGLLRDFFYQMSKEIGNPNYSLFKYSRDNSYELEINPFSSIADHNHLQYFRFIGRIIGLAIFNKQYLPVSFTLPLYKRLLNKSLEFSDLEYVDRQLFKNLQQLRDKNGAEYLYLTFSMDVEDCFGNHKTIDLKPNGAYIDVTDFNKNEYINLIVEEKLKNTNDKEQLDALKQGFYEIIPQNINLILDEIDLKFLISGISMIDIDDWENNTDYEGYKKDDITIINFWKCVRNFSNENRIKLLLFATGNSQIPVTGFKDLKGSGKIQHFKLKKSGTENDLPKSHTCFNRIDLPPYTSLTIMRQKLLLAISEGMGGFSME